MKGEGYIYWEALPRGSEMLSEDITVQESKDAEKGYPRGQVCKGKRFMY